MSKNEELFEYVYDLTNDNLKNLNNVKRIKSYTYYLETKNDSYILKKINMKKKFSKIKRWFNRITFKNEIEAYKQLNKINLDFFEVPNLIYNQKDYFLLEFIEPNQEPIDMDKSSIDVVDSVLEFNMIELDTLDNFFEKKFFNLFKRINWKLMRFALISVRKKYGIFLSVKLIWIVIVNSFKQKNNKITFTLHDDLFGFNNLILSEDKLIHFVDFEGVIAEKKWILLDILDLCLDPESFDFDDSLLTEYLDKLSDRTDFEIRLNVKAQLQMALLKRVIEKVTFVNSKRSASKNRLYVWENALKMLTSKKKYDKWYSKNLSVDSNVNITNDSQY